MNELQRRVIGVLGQTATSALGSSKTHRNDYSGSSQGGLKLRKKDSDENLDYNYSNDPPIRTSNGGHESRSQRREMDEESLFGGATRSVSKSNRKRSIRGEEPGR